MSENRISDAEFKEIPKSEGDNGKYKLPPVEYPKMDMPEPPKVPNSLPPDVPRPASDGTMELMPGVNPAVPDPKPGVRRILIGVPLLDIKYEFFESFMRFWSELLLARDPNLEIGYHIAYRKPVHMAEEYLVNVAKNNKCTHILLMDDDIYDVTKADLDKLIAADKDVIGGVMHASKFPHAMCVFRRYNKDLKVIDMPADNSMYRLYEVPCLCKKCTAPISHWDAKFCLNCGEPQDNLIQQADLIPFPFTLIKMSVFDKIKKPWFHCTSTYPTDSWFADRLIEAGMTEYAHMAVRLNHAGITDATKPFYMQMGMAKAHQAKAVVNISPEEMEKHQFLLMNKMKETEASQKPKPVFASEGKPAANAEKLGEKELTLQTHGF